LFDHGTHEAYGILANDNKTIQPLTDEKIRWLEASNIAIRVEESGKKGDLKKKSKKVDDEDEEELDKLKNNIADEDAGGDEDIDLGDEEEDLGSDADDSEGEEDDIDLEDDE
jgi:hypothetical protein